MNLQTFKAPTMAEALQQVKSVMGGDAVILHTRTYQLRQWLGLKRREMVEITAGRGLNVVKRPRQIAAQPRPSASGAAYGPGFTRSAVRPSVQPTLRTPAENSRQLLETPAAGNAMMLGITQEMTQLKMMVKDLLSETRQAQTPQVPEELFEYYLQLIQNEVAEELAKEIVKTLAARFGRNISRRRNMCRSGWRSTLKN